MTRTDNDVEIDFKDLFFYILSKWKLLIVLMVLGAIGAGAFSYYRSGRAVKVAEESNETYSEDKLEAARAALSEDSALNVETIYRQYHAYQESQQISANRIAHSVFFTDTADSDPVLKILKYCIGSDVQNIDSYFADMSLGSDQIEEIRKIIGADNDTQDIQDLVSIYSSDSTDYSGQTDVSQVEMTTGRYRTFLTVSIVGFDKSQCDEIGNIVDAAIQNEKTTLQGVDTNISVDYVDAQYPDGAEDYINDKQQSMLSSNGSIISAITSLQTNQISQFSDEEKTYYDLLTARDNVDENEKATETVTASASVSKKYVVAGIAGGLLLAIIIAIILYNSDHSVKTADELTLLYGIPLLDTIKMSDKKGSREVQEELLASDISITANKNALKSCYFIADEADMGIVDEIQTKIENITTGSGQPLTDTDELKKLAAMDAIVIVTHLKKTQLATIDKIGDLAGRFDLKVVGTVAVED